MDNKQQLTSANVQQALDTLDLGIRVQFFDTSTATSQEAADSIGCEVGQIAKSLAFIIDDQPILVVASGDQRIDPKKLAKIFEVANKRVKVAKPEQCVEYYGYAPGGVPPVGLRQADIPVCVDDSLQRYEQVYAAAGVPNAIFPILLSQLIDITNGRVFDLKKD